MPFNESQTEVCARSLFPASLDKPLDALDSFPQLLHGGFRMAGLIEFSPAMKDGRAVSMYIQLEYNFNLY